MLAILTANTLKHMVGESRPSMRRGYRSQRENLDIFGLELADHVSRIESTIFELSIRIVITMEKPTPIEVRLLPQSFEQSYHAMTRFCVKYDIL